MSVRSKESAIVSSSSGYSTATSIDASVSTSSFFIESISSNREPESLPAARPLDASVRLSMISRTASAFVKSVFPLTYARNVNSPRSASRNPFASSNLLIALTTAGPPWQEISAISSPVKLFGARKTDTSTSSIFLSPSEIQPYTIVFPPAFNNASERENSSATSSMQPFPEVRTMPSALGASAVAIAAIGSSGV